jgi:hypothetical protein
MTKFAFLLLVALLPGIVKAQFNYTVNNNTVTITGYTGPGGAVEIPSTIAGLPVVEIHQGAFNPYYAGNSSNVTSVTIPNGVINIDIDAFESCAMTNVTFGATVTYIGDGAFDCGNLLAITADPGNQTYSTANGVLFDKNKTSLIQCPMAKTGNYFIPDSVTYIYGNAFFGCRGLTQVTIGNGVISMGPGAFQRCTGLTSIIIPDRVINIPGSGTQGAFSYCTGLTNVTIGRGVTSIGQYAFSDCTALMSLSIPSNVTSLAADAFQKCGLTNVTIANGITNIGDSAFDDCPGLTSVTLPQSVISIGICPFSACTGLQTITVDAANTSYSSVDGVLFNKNQTVLIQWPGGRGGSYVIPNSVTKIGDFAFLSSLALTNVTIDAGLTNLGSHTFTGCDNLTAVYFEGNAPAVLGGPFGGTKAIAYYLPGTTGWSATYGGIPTALWRPLILTSQPNFGVRTNNFGFTVSWAPNTQVVVEACTNLVSPAWSSLATLALTGGSAYFSDAQWTNYPDRFYRLRSF